MSKPIDSRFLGKILMKLRKVKIAVCLDIFLQGEHPRLTSTAARSEML